MHTQHKVTNAPAYTHYTDTYLHECNFQAVNTPMYISVVLIYVIVIYVAFMMMPLFILYWLLYCTVLLQNRDGTMHDLHIASLLLQCSDTLRDTVQFVLVGCM